MAKNLGALMKQIQEMQTRMTAVQAELETLKRAVDEETEQNLQKIRERLRSRR